MRAEPEMKKMSAVSITRRLRREVREIGLVSVFFLLWFLLFLSLKKLILAEYHIGVRVVGTAVIGALVVAKVVVILDKTAVAAGFRSNLLIVHVLWRSVTYTAVVFVVTLAERLVHAYRAQGEFTAAVAEL